MHKFPVTRAFCDFAYFYYIDCRLLGQVDRPDYITSASITITLDVGLSRHNAIFDWLPSFH